MEVIYSKRHNKFLFPSLAGAIYGSSCNAENEISNVVNYNMPDFINELKSSTYKKGVTVTPKILFLFYSRIKQELGDRE